MAKALPSRISSLRREALALSVVHSIPIAWAYLILGLEALWLARPHT